jgi:hypothetical protein
VDEIRASDAAPETHVAMTDLQNDYLPFPSVEPEHLQLNSENNKLIGALKIQKELEDKRINKDNRHSTQMDDFESLEGRIEDLAHYVTAIEAESSEYKGAPPIQLDGKPTERWLAAVHQIMELHLRLVRLQGDVELSPNGPKESQIPMPGKYAVPHYVSFLNTLVDS